MKKAFTLSEALITLAILGVLAAILIPVIDSARPDKDKITYKKALYTMQGAVSNAMDSTVYSVAANSAAYWKDENIGEEDFCRSIADSLNIAGRIKCGTSDGYSCEADEVKPAGSSCYSDPNFITTDGIRYWGLEGKFADDTREIFVDRAIGTNELKAVERSRNKTGNEAKGLKIRVHYNGKVDTADTPEYDFENDLIENSLQITQSK